MTGDQETGDEALVHLAQAGNVDAFGELYERHAPAIFRYLFARVSDRQQVEDMTNEVFVRVWDALPNYEQRGVPFKSYLFRVAHNLLVGFYRKFRHSLPLYENTARAKENPEELAETRIAWEGAMEALEILPAHYRRVLELRFFAGLSSKEIGQVLGKTAGAVRVTQHRALVALRRALKGTS